MEREELLKQMYFENWKKAVTHKKEYYTNPSVARVEPFKIADNLYYVGDSKVCVHLIDTGEGLVLIDSGYPHAIHLLVDSIWRLGFDPSDVKWILHTHGHADHFGASTEFNKMYGTRLAISKVDADAIREKPHRAHLEAANNPYYPLPKFDYELEDGEIFELGRLKIRCVLTPGHTMGVMSFFFDVTYNGETYLAGLFGGAGLNALTLPYICYNEELQDAPYQMLNSIDRIIKEPVAVHLGNHPGNNKTLQKRELQLKNGGNPFVDKESWKTFLEEQKEKVRNVIAENEILSKKLKN